MSVTLQTPFKDFIAAPGATLFSTDFRVILATDLVVRKDDVVQTSGFTVSGLGNPSGVDVTFGVPMVGGERIELQRSVPLVRSTDYQQTGDFLSPVVNIDFDRLWMALQDQQFVSGLAILLPVGDPLAPMSIPDVAARAGKFFAFDALGQAIAAAGATGVPVTAFMATLLDDLNAAAARGTLGLGALATVAIAPVANGGTGQTTAAGIQSILPIQQTRVDVASAGTVNLTAGAPNTDHVNITGTTTISGFTVAAGRLIFVRFNAALTLTNNANIVTQTGANIVTAAGDVCILRATAANVVEVLGYVSSVANKQSTFSRVKVQGNNGYGSTNTVVRRFTSITESTGTDIAYADSATLGASFTINTAGRYTITYVDNFGAAADAQITRNSTSLAALNGDFGQVLAEGSSAGASTRVCLAWSGFLSAGDVVRAQTGGTAGSTSRNSFDIQRVL